MLVYFVTIPLPAVLKSLLMGQGGSPLTDFQARLLFELCEQFLNGGPGAGFAYEQMMGNTAISATSIAMLKKTIHQLRTREKPLVSSHAEPLGKYQKGRRPDIFTINPNNIITKPEAAYIIFFIYWSLSTMRNEREAKSDVELIVTRLIEREYSLREGPDYVNLQLRGNYLNELWEAAAKMFENERPTIEAHVRDELNSAYQLGYLVEPPSDAALRLTPKALSEVAYLQLHHQAFDPPYKRPPPSTKPMESGPPRNSAPSKPIAKGRRKAVKPKPKKRAPVARKAVKAKPKRQRVKRRQ
jgi:hypothetical protein